MREKMDKKEKMDKREAGEEREERENEWEGRCIRLKKWMKDIRWIIKRKWMRVKMDKKEKWMRVKMDKKEKMNESEDG